MTSLIKPILMLFAAVAAVALTWIAVNRWYLTPRIALKDQIGKATVILAEQRAAREDSRNVSKHLQGFVDRTLGPNLETVDHRLRSRLNRLCEQSKLQGVSVGTEGAGKDRFSPAKIKFRSSSHKALRDEIDFVELEAWISGVGALEDVVRLISSIEAEPWIKRIDQVRLDPRDNGARMTLSLRLTTLFLPGRAPRGEQPPPTVVEPDARYVALVSGNPFRVPPPPEPQPAAPAPRQPAAPLGPPPFPFDQWAITGLAQGPSGPEAWLLHRPSGQTRVLGVGQQIDAAVFSGATGDAAGFTLGPQRFVVAVGATMDQRSQIGP
jgi:hypothetical protein